MSPRGNLPRRTHVIAASSSSSQPTRRNADELRFSSPDTSKGIHAQFNVAALPPGRRLSGLSSPLQKEAAHGRALAAAAAAAEPSGTPDANEPLKWRSLQVLAGPAPTPPIPTPGTPPPPPPLRQLLNLFFHHARARSWNHSLSPAGDT